MIKLKSHEFLVYHIEFKGLSVLVLEILMFEKYVKYANERTDDVIYTTQYNIKHNPI